MEIKMKVPKGFELEKAVCNHGFFMMAPNRWMPSTKTLVRPLRLRDQLSVTVSISQISPTSLLITIPDDNPISFSHCPYITDQVTRMLRLSPTEEARVKEFHRLHADAAKKGFGRLFRNPSLFEDLIKSLLLCSSSFQKTLEMAEGLCVLQKRLDVKEGLVRNAKRGRKKASDCDEESWGNFPSIEELALLDNKENLLRNNCKLGYRARWVMLLVQNVTKGKICLMDLEKLFDGNQLYPILRSFNGFGDFAASNAFMCMGFYDRVPCDTETIRHFKQVHGRIDCDHKNVWAMANERYDMYAPFQALAYWLEMVDYYEINLGKLSLLDRCRYKNVAGTSIDRSS